MKRLLSLFSISIAIFLLPVSGHCADFVLSTLDKNVNGEAHIITIQVLAPENIFWWLEATDAVNGVNTFEAGEYGTRETQVLIPKNDTGSSRTITLFVRRIEDDGLHISTVPDTELVINQSALSTIENAPGYLYTSKDFYVFAYNKALPQTDIPDTSLDSYLSELSSTVTSILKDTFHLDSQMVSLATGVPTLVNTTSHLMQTVGLNTAWQLTLVGPNGENIEGNTSIETGKKFLPVIFVRALNIPGTNAKVGAGPTKLQIYYNKGKSDEQKFTLETEGYLQLRDNLIYVLIPRATTLNKNASAWDFSSGTGTGLTINEPGSYTILPAVPLTNLPLRGYDEFAVTIKSSSINLSPIISLLLNEDSESSDSPLKTTEGMFAVYGSTHVFTNDELATGEHSKALYWNRIFVAPENQDIDTTFSVASYSTIYIQSTATQTPGSSITHRYDYIGTPTQPIENIQYSSNLEGGFFNFLNSVSIAGDYNEATAQAIMARTYGVPTMRIKALHQNY
ncbi:MAG: hypothetical protein V3571_01585 [Pseudodesulfovibrio sp.]